MLYENWVSSSNQSETFFGDQVDKCYKFVIKQGQTLFIPTGWIHAVFTPIDSLVFGGNFLHSLNIPLQLESYAIERRVKTPEKYLFPHFETLNWYAAKHVLDTLREFLEEGKKPPPYLVKGGAALLTHLKSWTQRKDFHKEARHDLPEHITYGKLLKDLSKEVKSSETQVCTLQHNQKPAPLKARGDRKKKKVMPTPKQMQNINLLHQHTQEKLLEMENQQKKNIYNFDEEEETLDPNSLKVRIPKAGAYIDPANKVPIPTLPANVKEPIVGLKLKVSNGKIVKLKGKESVGKFQPLVSSTVSGGDSDKEDQLVVDENPRASRLNKPYDNGISASTLKPGSLKMKLSLNSKQALDTSLTSTSQESSEESDFKSDHLSPIKPLRLDMKALKAEKIVSTQQKTTVKTDQKPPLKTDQKPSVKNEQKPSVKTEQKLTVKTGVTPKTEVKTEATPDENADGTEELTDRLTMPTIRGGLNGSIADILEASGYGTETDFKVDEEFDSAESPSMRDAIQGMLSMSRMGSMHLFSKQQENRRSATIKLKNKQRQEEDEKCLESCYKDNEFFYPSLDFSEDEEEYVLKKGHQERDDNWNPKARIYITPPQGHRPNRDNAKRENVESVLETARLKPEVPKTKKPPVSKKKPKSDKVQSSEPVPGTSSEAIFEAQKGSAFRPSLKRPIGSQGPDSPTKVKKPKKGLATAKQRLGKILKIHKMGIH
ncbi:hypothetical protein ScPMuIL_009228 [Solemya velum]